MVLKPGVGVAMSVPTLKLSVAQAVEDRAAVVAHVEEAIRPRWVVWSSDTVAT